MKIIRHLPCAPFPPTKAVYKKPVLYNNSKHMRVVELPCQYNPRPAPLPKKKKPEIRKSEAWTEEKEQLLIDMYNRGETYEAISKAVGRVKSNVHHKIKLLISRGDLKERRDKRCKEQQK